jgi:hypothetical protein
MSTADGARGPSRTAMIAELRRLQSFQLDDGAPAQADEQCDLCGATIPPEHRHLVHLEQRRIVCSCETCRALLSGDTPYRPVGTRTVWLPELELGDEVWAGFAIPIGLAFFVRNGGTGAVVARYPSPAGAMESELPLAAWAQLEDASAEVRDLEADIEGLIVDRLGSDRRYAIAPLDECYRLVGLIRTRWTGMSGGSGVEQAVDEFFDDLRERAA